MAVKSIGYARESTVEGIRDILSVIEGKVNNFSFDSSSNILAAINADNVGLAKDVSVKNMYTSHILSTSISLANTGTAAKWMNVLSSASSVPFTGLYTIVIALSAATTVKLDVTVGTVTYSYYLNDGNALSADSWYAFDIPLNEGDLINVEVNVPAGTTVSGVLRVFGKR